MSISLPTTQMTGLSSGLDWGDIIDEQMTALRKNEDPWYDKIQLLNDKIYLYQEFSSSVKAAQSSLDPLKLESTFTSKTPELVVVGSNESSDAILKVDLEPSAQIQEWNIKVNSLAVAERRLSDRQDSSSTPFGKSGSFFVRIGTKAAEITYESSDSLRTIAEKIRSADIGLDAYLIDNRLVVESENTGLGSSSFTEKVTRGSGDYDALGANGIDPSSIGDITVGSTTYENGTDFEVIADSATGGYQIHWLGASRPGETSTYDVSYDYDANTFGLYEIRETLSKDLTRATGSDYDTIDVENLDTSTVSIAGYTEGTDYEIVEDPDDEEKWAIHWIGSKPADGATFSIDYSNTDNSLLDGLGILTEDATHHRDAQDASLTVNGIDVTRSSNEIDDLIGGATLNLQGVGEVNMEVTLNAQKAVESIEAFVESYNDLMEYINVRSEEKTYNYSDSPNSDTKAVPEDDLSRRKGLLAGDTVLWQTKSNLRKIISESVGDDDDTFNMLYQIGISTEEADFGKSGKLEFDTDKFMEAMATDSDSVQKLVKTISESLDTQFDSVVSTSTVAIGDTSTKEGRIPSQINVWENEVTQLQQRIKDYEERITTQQLNMYKQYAAMEEQMTKLNYQASSLSSTFSSLAASGNS